MLNKLRLQVGWNQTSFFHEFSKRIRPTEPIKCRHIIDICKSIYIFSVASTKIWVSLTSIMKTKNNQPWINNSPTRYVLFYKSFSSNNMYSARAEETSPKLKCWFKVKGQIPCILSCKLWRTYSMLGQPSLGNIKISYFSNQELI